MFENFTDRSVYVMLLANTEAVRFNHSYIETAHVLIGLADEGDGIAATVLREAGIDASQIRDQIQKFIFSDPLDPSGSSGKVNYSERVKASINHARAYMKLRGHTRIGTEHLLLGILKDRNCVAIQAIANIKRENFIQEIEQDIYRLLDDSNNHDERVQDPVINNKNDKEHIRHDMAYSLTTPYLKADSVYFLGRTAEGLWFQNATKKLLVNGDYVLKEML